MDTRELLLDFLKREVRPAVGCTEPVAVALNVARGVEVLASSYEDIDSLTVTVSKGIFKNGMDVGIPGTDLVGLDMAAALGLVVGDSSQGLEILKSVDREKEALAKEVLASGKIKIKALDDNRKVYIESSFLSKGREALVRTEGKHDRIVYIELAGKVLEDLEDQSNLKEEASTCPESSDLLKELTIRELVEAVEEIDYKDLLFLLEGIRMNMAVAELGLSKPYGLGVGYNFKQNIDKGYIAKDLVNTAYMLTSAASDVRMSGETIPIMSSCCSGNNGITAILPIAAYKEIWPDTPDEKLVKALAISHAITSYIKKHIGLLSNLCGCSLAASIGSACGISWILAGPERIEPTINNILANQAGVICDGAKPGCALKLGTAAATGVQAALLALEGTRVEGKNGIIGRSVEDSIRNLGKLSSQGMSQLDDTIIEIMINR